ncbi:DUF6264 family protein [Microbacterium amylolyticum]|uniref:Integral membrane protein n=1 Tax=Microbacterium amylolyticum TaxID=936337 RepID=A0ABS4ZF86_9MICO|nr:DUF6264 family protein [Microbacterium amylolyticum]MBP2435944.1 hypothetical protein [Microbacterium amylolyticum]
MNDDTRPNYGEYASADDRARYSPPVPPVDPALIPQDSPATPAPTHTGKISTRQLVDRVVTFALLAYGLFSSLSSISLFTDPYGMVGLVGLDVTLSDPSGMRSAGTLAVIVLVGGWAATTWLCWKRSVARKSTWWVALLAGVVFNFAAAIVLSIALVQDPNVMQAIVDLQGIELN